MKKIQNISQIITTCFRKPEGNEAVKTMNSTQILELIRKEYPAVKIDHSTRVHLGQAMKELGYEHKEYSHVAFYKVVPLRVA